MKDLLNKFFDRTFWKFILVGVANTIFGTGIMFVFYNVFHFSYWVSSASNYFFFWKYSELHTEPHIYIQEQ